MIMVTMKNLPGAVTGWALVSVLNRRFNPIGGGDNVIDDYGDDEEFAWYSHWLGISVLNRRSNPILGKLVLPSCLIVQPPTNMVFRVN